VQLQIALDRIPLERAVTLTALVAEQADWIEVGTSLVKRYGMAAVEAIVEAAGRTPVLADTKTADDARTEMTMCFDAGARAASVLGLTADATVLTCAQVARERGSQVLVDLLGVSPERRSDLLALLGTDAHVVWAPHIGKDTQGTTVTPRLDAVLGPWARGLKLAIAGGLTAPAVAALSAGWPDLRVIVGSAVTSSADPLAAVSELRAAMSTPLTTKGTE
jgi:3-hexulose-6-phosphate synthase